MHIDKADTSKLLRGCLKAAFPKTQFSIRQRSGNFDVAWTDGPTGRQVRPLLQRFESKHFDGMTDMESSDGSRILMGVKVYISGGYVSGQRTTSKALTAKVSRLLAAQCGQADVAIDEWGNPPHSLHVPFQWHEHWHRNEKNEEIPLALSDIEDGHFLSSDPREGEYLSRLVGKVVSALSFEAQSDIPLELLPTYPHEWEGGLLWLLAAIGYDQRNPSHGFHLTGYRGTENYYPHSGVLLTRNGVEVGRYLNLEMTKAAAVEMVANVALATDAEIRACSRLAGEVVQ